MKRTAFVSIGIFLFVVHGGIEAGNAEILEAGFYRTPSGSAIVRISGVATEDGWETVLKTKKGGSRNLQLTRTYAGGRKSVIDLVFSPRAEGNGGMESAGKKLAEETREVRKKAGWLVETAGQTREKMNGSTALVQILAGKDRTGIQYKAEVMAVTDGQDLVTIVIFGETVEWDGALRVPVETIKRTLLIGRAVPWLHDREIAVKLDGVYKGPAKAGRTGVYNWLLFDKRGYMSDSVPAGLRSVDFDAYLQEGGKDPSSYECVGDRIIFRAQDEGVTEKEFKPAGDRLIIVDGKRYERLDGMSRAVRLDGRYVTEFPVSQENGNMVGGYAAAECLFTQSGKFSFDGTGAGTNRDTTGPVESNSTWSSLSGNKGPRDGTYSISGDRIIFKSSNGEAFIYTFFLDSNEGIPIKERIFISGASQKRVNEAAGDMKVKKEKKKGKNKGTQMR